MTMKVISSYYQEETDNKRLKLDRVTETGCAEVRDKPTAGRINLRIQTVEVYNS